MMLNIYEEPKIEIIKFDGLYDVITTSGETDTKDEDEFDFV